MPIRFRCAYCNQLLGIARRKAGQVVRCPTCAGQVVVPQSDEVPPDEPAMPPGPGTAPDPPLFERDFDLNFDAPAPPSPPLPAGGAAMPAPAAAAAGAAWPGAPPSPQFDVERYDGGGGFPEGAPAGGIVLSPAKATLLTVLAIIGMAVAFGVGLIVGRFML